MTKFKYKADKALLSQAQKLAKKQIANLGDSQTLLVFLECLGTLIYLGEDAAKAVKALVLAAQAVLPSTLRLNVYRALKALDPLDIARARKTFNTLTPTLPLLDEDEEEEIAVSQQILEALSKRDKISLIHAGAVELLGKLPRLPKKLAHELVELDSDLRENGWRLIPLGDLRATQVVWAAPEYRERLWWWSIGMNIPATGLEEMSTVAMILHLFPAAQKELDKLTRAQKELDKLIRAE